MRKQTIAIAIDLGATNMRVALVSRGGKIIEKRHALTPRNGTNGTVVTRQIVRLIHDMIDGARSRYHIEGIGISSIGPLDYKRGGPTKSPNVPYAFIPLVKPIQKAFELPVRLLNDCNAAVLGEQYIGAGKKMRHIVYITISTGIGGGVIAGGQLLEGRSGNAAELGHLIVDSAFNLPCTCGRGIGHWEGYASGRNMPHFLKHWLRVSRKKFPGTVTDSAAIFAAAKSGNPTARAFLDALAKIHARAISDIIVAYDPELITIGGTVALQNSDWLLSGIKRYRDRYLPTPPIRITPLGENITILGAAAAVFDRKKITQSGY